MASHNSASNVLLQLIFVALIQGFEAQNVKVSPEVTAYLGRDVTLPCQFIQTSKPASISQVEWIVQQLDGNKTRIIVVNKEHMEHIHDSFLKERVMMSEQSLIIKNVEMTDAGLYTCTMATFPYGSVEGTTNLIVREQVSISTGTLSIIVTIVVLLLVLLTAMIYLCVIKKCNSHIGHRVVIDTADPTMNWRDEDVVYSDVRLRPDRDGSPSSSDKHRVASYTDNVLYSEVIIPPQQSR